MREIHVSKIAEAVAELCVRSNYELGDDVYQALKDAMEVEDSPIARDILAQLIENADIARRENMPICQDTGYAVVLIELGQDVHIVGGLLSDAVNAGVAKGYTEGYLRKSIVAHPLERKNTGDNTPAVIYTDIVAGDRLRIMLAPKGGGSENMSAVRMMKPSDGIEGVKQFVVETVKAAGPNPCPPLIIGVGIGGTMDKAAVLAKKALFRRVGEHNANPSDASLEKELLSLVNETGIGPGGFGGRTTALAVNVETYPCHIASLPVAINIQCHAARHKEIII
ncbi:MAG: fumarate hydratase [Armatimonadetes bacterium]|nr:fumarate hydratase [Armatimonadota bacterium]